MKAKLLYIFILMFSLQTLHAQVGIGTTDPKANLDIPSSSLTSPLNTDGILIPRIDNFPTANPSADQDGMMVFVTGNGSSSKGFYYWNNNTTSWVSVRDSDTDFYEIGTTSNPDAITDDIYTLGKVKIGQNSPANSSLSIHDWNPNNSNSFTVSRSLNTASSTGQFSGSYITLDAQTSDNYFGYQSFLSGNIQAESANFHAQAVGTLNSNTNLFSGRFYSASGNGRLYGANVSFMSTVTNTGSKYGFNVNIPSSLTGTHYGLYSDVRNTTGYAAYLLGRTSLGDTSANRYLMPSADGTAGQVMTTDGAGNLTFQDVIQDTDWITSGSDIERQSGNVYIGDTNTTNNNLYISNQLIDWDDSAYFINPDENSVVNSMRFNDGSSSNPKIHFSDLDSGFFSPSAATTAYTANGNEAFRIQSDGELSINKTTPSQFNFTVRGNVSNNEVRMGNWGSTSSVIEVDHDHSTGNGIYVESTSSHNSSNKSTIATYNSLANVNTDISKYESGFNSYGVKTIISSNSSGTEYGIHSDVQTADGYAAYLIGRTSLGNNISNRYLMPLTDGNNGQVMTTDGAGNVTFQNISEDYDWHVQGSSLSSTNINDDIYTLGNVAIGDTSSSNNTLYVETDPSINNTSISNILTATPSGLVKGIENQAVLNGTANAYLISNSISGSSSGSSIQAIRNSFSGSGGGSKTGMYNFFTFGFSGTARGIENNFNNTGINSATGITNTFDTTSPTSYNTGVYNVAYSSHNANYLYGSRTSFIGASVTNEAYGTYNLITTTGTDYGVYSQVDNNATDYAAFFSGRISLGHDPAVNRYFLPGSDGTAGQVMTTDGAGNVTFQDATADSDNQQIDTFAFDTTTNILTLEVEDDEQAAQTVDLSTLQDGIGSDDQNLALSGTNLSIEDGNSINLNTINTDNQQIDNIGLSGTVLGISLEDDGVAPVTIDLSSINTDNQQIDTFNFNSSTNLLTLEVEDDGQPAQTVDLSSLNPTKSLARITMSTDQSLTTSAWQKLNFDTVDFDLGSEFNTTTDEFEVSTTGYYRINASWRSTLTSTSTDAFGIAIVVNGAIERAVNFNNSGNGFIFRSINRVLDLNAGDTVEIHILPTGPMDILSTDIVTAFEIEQIR